MGASKQEFIDLRMQMNHYSELDKKIKSNMEIRNVFESGWDDEFKKDESYNRLKKESTKAYKELKEREFIIQNSKKK